MSTTIYGIKVFNTDLAVRRMGADPKGHDSGVYYFRLEDADKRATVFEAMDNVVRTEITVHTVY